VTRCCAIVPVKRRAAAKRRLAPALAPGGRIALTRAMLASVLEALAGSTLVDEVVVVSGERDTIPARLRVLPDPGGGLNTALDSARARAAAEGADEILVLPADLPLVTPADVDAMIECGRRGGFALAGDRAGTGTNALFLPARSAFRFRFGAHSRARHLAEAAAAGLAPALVESPGLAFDVDTPADLDCLRAARDARYTFLQTGTGGGAWPTGLTMQLG
jgi:2-phospho-L-lactate guanylyltransferase